MLLVDMHPAVPTAATLEELLSACAPADRSTHEGTCLACAGETLRVELRGGVHAWACRECGSVLEDEDAVAA